MKEISNVISPEELLSHADFVRSIARSLVLDEHLAEDVVQETWLASLRHPPEKGRPLRPWLAAIARNLSFLVKRDKRQRMKREKVAAKPESVCSAEEIVQLKATVRQIVDAVFALSEPYRSTIIFRFYQGLPPRKIAKKQGIPINTVRTHIRRGLEMLRKDLDAAYGGSRKKWHLALAPFASLPLATSASGGTAAVTSLTVGTFVMSTKLKIAFAGVLILIAAFATFQILRNDRKNNKPPPLKEVAQKPAPDTSRAKPVVASLKESKNSRKDDSPLPMESASQETVPAFILLGEVQGQMGEQVEGAKVIAFSLSNFSQTIETETDKEGKFIFKKAQERHRYRIQASKEGLGSNEGVFQANKEEKIIIRLKKGGRFYGFVRHANEVPAVEYSLRLVRSSPVREEFHPVEEYMSHPHIPEVFRIEGPFRFTAGDGYFEIEGLRPASYQIIVNIKDGPRFKGGGVEIAPEVDVGPLEIIAPEEEEIRIAILDALTGESIPGARVKFGYGRGLERFVTIASVRADESGHLAIKGIDENARCIAEAPGYAKRLDSLQIFRYLKEKNPSPEIEIQLSPSVGLNVFVTDDQGEFIKGARVNLFLSEGRLVFAKTDEKGKAVFHDLPAGKQVILICLYSNGLFDGMSVDLPERETKDIHLGGRAATEGAQIIGTVYMGVEPLRAGHVIIYPLKDSGYSGIGTFISVNEEGRFYSGPLAPGRYDLMLRIGPFLHDNDHQYRLHDIVVGNRPKEVSIDIPTGSIKGKVIMHGPYGLEPASGVAIIAFREPRSGELPNGIEFKMQGRGRTDSLGRFEIPALPDGEYKLTFELKKRRIAEKTIKFEVREGNTVELGEIAIN